MRQHRAGLERAAGDARDDEPAADDMGGGGKGGFRAGLVAEEGLDEDVVGPAVPDERRVRTGGVGGVGDRFQRLVINEDRLGRVARFRAGLGDRHRDGLADIARLVSRQQRVIPDEHLRPAGPVQLEVEAGLGQRAVVELAEPVRRAIRPGEDGQHARQREGGGGVDRQDARMRMGRAHHRRAGLARQGEVVGEAAPAGQQARILLAPDRPADGSGMFDATPAT